MSERPELNSRMDGTTFRSYYYLKEELVDFCREKGLPACGGKIEITDRIAHFLDTGEVKTVSSQSKTRPSQAKTVELSEDTLIEQGFICSEKHRAFFKDRIGKSFSFNVAFQKWLKSNPGKTYGQAIEAYYAILEEKKNSKTKIDKQFEYNTYIRDFFADNSQKSLEEAIRCWKYKKGLQGHNRYEKEDLAALEQ